MLGTADTDMSGLVAAARVRRLVVRVADVVAVHVAHEDDVDLAQPRIARAGDGAARVVEDARAVRVLEDQRPILRAELAVDAAERRHLHGLGQGGEGQRGAEGAQGCDPGQTIHGIFLPFRDVRGLPGLTRSGSSPNRRQAAINSAVRARPRMGSDCKANLASSAASLIGRCSEPMACSTSTWTRRPSLQHRGDVGRGFVDRRRRRVATTLRRSATTSARVTIVVGELGLAGAAEDQAGGAAVVDAELALQAVAAAPSCR